MKMIMTLEGACPEATTWTQVADNGLLVLALGIIVAGVIMWIRIVNR